jgi:hypothetical protein
MGLLTRAAILEADDLPRERVPVPEWGGEVLVARLAGSARFAFHQYQAGLPTDSFDHVAHLVALTVVDEDGVRLFTEEDVKALNEKSAAALLRVFRAALRHNRLGDTEVDAAKGESGPSRSSATA